MRLKRLGLKVSLIVTIMIGVIVGITMLIVSIQTDKLVTELASDEAKAANIAFVRTIEALEEDALARANMIARSQEVIFAFENGNYIQLQRTLENFMSGLDIITIVDTKGDVVLRAHSDKKGDSLAYMDVVTAALQTGKGTSTIERGSLVGLSTRASAPVMTSDGRIIGAIICGHDLSQDKYVDEMKLRSNCEATIFDYDIRLTTTLYDEEGKRATGTPARDIVIETVLVNQTDYSDRIELYGSTYYAYYSPIIVEGEAIGMLYTGVNIDGALESRNELRFWVAIAIAASGIACIVLIIAFGTFAIGRPLRKIGKFVERVQTGDLGLSTGEETVSIDVRSHDEIGMMAQTLEKAFAELRGFIEEIRTKMQGLSEGDFVTESYYEFQGDFVLIKDSFNNIIENLNQTMREVSASAIQVSASSAEVAEGSQNLAQGAVEQASAIDELSTIVSDIMDETGKNAVVAREATELTGVIRGKAEKGSVQMDNMMRAIHEITDASNQISKVIKVIDDIAFQTNILALNAAVEAARAGQHGKGFAVVADEVRDLATKSAVAANDSEKLIADSVEKAKLGLNIAIETADSLNEIVEGINRSAEIVDQIANSSDEQAIAIAQVNTGIDQVAQVIRQNSSTAERSAAASEEMSGRSEMLRKLMSYFRIDH